MAQIGGNPEAEDEVEEIDLTEDKMGPGSPAGVIQLPEDENEGAIAAIEMEVEGYSK